MKVKYCRTSHREKYGSFIVKCVFYLPEGELQTGSVVWQCERENSGLFAAVTAGPDPGGVQVEVPSLTHRRERLLYITTAQCFFSTCLLTSA